MPLSPVRRVISHGEGFRTGLLCRTVDTTGYQALGVPRKRKHRRSISCSARRIEQHQ